MNRMRSTIAATALLAALGVTAAFAAGGTSSDKAAQGRLATASDAEAAAVVLEDKRGDVTKSKLDIDKVRVLNTAKEVKVRVHFPGVAQAGDFPTGAVSVFLDTDPARPGAEYGHFMDFFSEYRFAEVSKWREEPQEDSSSSARLRTDKQHKLRWHEFVVAKDGDPFEANAVRVAVTTINTGDLEPTVAYDPAFYDHLGAKHAWSQWIPVTS